MHCPSLKLYLLEPNAEGSYPIDPKFKRVFIFDEDTFRQMSSYHWFASELHLKIEEVSLFMSAIFPQRLNMLNL